MDQPSLTGILIATVPLTVVLIAPLFGVREKLGLRRLIGLAIGFLGVVTILGLDTGHGPMLWAGVVCMSLRSPATRLSDRWSLSGILQTSMSSALLRRASSLR